nr:MAG TPA: hypothetical protein [Caudoviricetes sp.]
MIRANFQNHLKKQKNKEKNPPILLTYTRIGYIINS